MMFVINLFFVKFVIVLILSLKCSFTESASIDSHICIKKHRTTVDGKSVRTKLPYCCTGYIADDTATDDRLVCKPICMPACVNATCINPGECQCNPGYRNTSNINTCEPICKPIPFSQCVAPDTIECNHGYTLVNNTCQPVCTEPCLFGKCTAPEFCQCHSGYRKSEANICEPYCSRGCYHGKCRAPDECECDAHFTKVDGTCICNQTCDEGSCVDPDTCQCDNVLIDSRCVNETEATERNDKLNELITDEPEIATEYDDQTDLSIVSNVNYTSFKEIEFENDTISDASQSRDEVVVSNCNWSWLWIVIVLLVLIFLLLCAYVLRNKFDCSKGKTYNVGEREARESRRRSNNVKSNIEINYLKNK